MMMAKESEGGKTMRATWSIWRLVCTESTRDRARQQCHLLQDKARLLGMESEVDIATVYTPVGKGHSISYRERYNPLVVSRAELNAKKEVTA